jgi:hypothetical protein
MNFLKSINNVFTKIKSRFKSNLFSLNFDKTYFLQIKTKNSHEINMKISVENKHITNIYNTKFLGLMIDNSVLEKP